MLLSTLLQAWGARADTLVAGERKNGVVHTNTVDSYTFTAGIGDRVVLRAGAATFTPALRLYAPDGALLESNQSSSFSTRDGEVTIRVTAEGTFTATVGSYYVNGTGDYALSLAKSPGLPVVSPGDDGGSLTPGWRHLGTIDVGDLDQWSFMGETGQNVVLRIGSTNFTPSIRVFGPDGVSQGANSSSSFSTRDGEVSFRATQSGVFTVVVSAYYVNGEGDYALSLAMAPGTIAVAPGDEGGSLTNGWRHAGVIEVGDLDVWSFAAQAGDTVVARSGSPSFTPLLRVYDPDGTLLDSSTSSSFSTRDVEVSFRAAHGGVFTLVTSAHYVNGEGDYSLSLATAPGAIAVAPGDEGGTLTNGWRHTGVIEVGDLDLWGFKAKAGEGILLRAGAVDLTPRLRVYGPDGAPQAANSSSSFSTRDGEVVFRATNSGDYSVVLSAYYVNGAGNYTLSLAKTGEGLVIAPGDEGGSMAGEGVYEGSLGVGDADIWKFTACVGDGILLRADGTNFTPALRLYGPEGSLLAANSSSSFSTRVAQLTYQATHCGTFVLVVGSYYNSGSGAYRLTANGLTDGLKLCVPAIGADRLTLSGVGGTPDAGFILSASDALTAPPIAWVPVLTNRFDALGVFAYTNSYDPGSPRRFYRVELAP